MIEKIKSDPFIFAAIFIMLLLCLGIMNSHTTPTFDSSEVNDTPLLTSRQKQEALETDAVAFDCAGVHYVITNGATSMPEEYLQ